MHDGTGNPILEMNHIVKRYDRLVANDDVSIALHHGEILAIIGENGAGKTTLMKILYGMEQPDGGEILLGGQRKRFRNASDAIASGIGMVQQHFMLFDPFTVAENVVYGKEPVRGLFFDLDKARTTVRQLSGQYELPLDPDATIHGMPVGQRQKVEILKVLYQNTDIIIFDEPTAVLTPQEVHELLATMKRLAALGKSIIIITHKLAEVMEVADRAIVMRGGKRIADVAISDTDIAQLGYMMVGHMMATREVPHARTGDDVLTIEDLVVRGPAAATASAATAAPGTGAGAGSASGGAGSAGGGPGAGSHNKIDHLSLHVRSGEIVGIAGVSGNGQSELERCILGLQKVDGGSISVLGRDVTNQPVAAVRGSGVSMIPEDRYLWGSAADASIMETAIMTHYRKPGLSKHGFLKMGQVRAFARDLVEKFSVKTDDIRFRTASLSGGNAQKLIAAREIAHGAPLLVACEPTRGVDIGAMEYIHDRLVEKRANGDAVLLISSELTEIMDLSDRIYVMYGGRIAGEFRRGAVREEELGLLMAGGSL